jgi:predicted esterase
MTALGGVSPEPVNSPVFDIPRLDNVVIDGKPDDWGDAGFRVEAMASVDGKVTPTSELDCRFRLAWDNQGLLVLLTVQGDSFIENDAEDCLWQNDCIELYLANRRGGTELIQATIAPGMDAKHPDLRYYLYDHRKDPALRKIKPTLAAARSKVAGGYRMEVRIPWASVGIAPQAGAEVGFQVFADRVRLRRRGDMVWYPAVGVFADTLRMHRLRLADHASPAVSMSGRASYDGLRCTRATVVATREMAGKTVAVLADGKPIMHGALESSEGRSLASLSGPVPAAGTSWKQVEILVEGRLVDTIAMPDTALALDKARRNLKYVFPSYCFTGTEFPEGALADPVEAGNAFGAYAVSTTYYDAQFNCVTAADKPGRYGAMVEVRAQNGEIIRRFITLYRMPPDCDWKQIRFAVPIELPVEMILAREASQDARSTLGFGDDRLIENFAEFPDSAIVLAWHAEMKPGAGATTWNSPWNANARWIHEVKRRTGTLTPLPYLVHVPDGNEAMKRPAIFLLHGSGGRSVSMESLARNAVITYAKAHQDFPFAVVVPHCSGANDQGWQVPLLDDLYDEVVAKYQIDPDRVYVMGESMGGFGTLSWVAAHPDRFAAVVPVCGAGNPREVGQYREVPAWVFHGAKDPAVPIRKSYEMVEALRQIHGRVRFTIYPDGGHVIWDDVYSAPELYAWMLRQARGRPEEPPSKVPGTMPSEQRATKLP